MEADVGDNAVDIEGVPAPPTPPPPPSSPIPAQDPPEEKALVDLVRLGQLATIYAQTGAEYARGKLNEWVPVARAYTTACWEAMYRQMYTQYALMNLRTRSYRYRTFVTFSLLVLMLFVFLDATFFATRIDPPVALRQKNVNLVDKLSQQLAFHVPEVREERPLTQEEDAKRHWNLAERTPGLGSKDKHLGSEHEVDPNKPSSVAKLLSKMVAKDANMLEYFRNVLDKHEEGVRQRDPVLHSRIGRIGIQNPSEGKGSTASSGQMPIFDQEPIARDKATNGPPVSTKTLQSAWGGKPKGAQVVSQNAEPPPRQDLPADQAWDSEQPQPAPHAQQIPNQPQPQNELEQPQSAPHDLQRDDQAPPQIKTADAVQESAPDARPVPQQLSYVDYENPYLLGDLGAAQMNLPHIHNISEHIQDLAAFTEALNNQQVPADDPRLVQLVKDYWIRKPSPHPYKLKQPELVDFSMGQAAVVDEILGHKENGFFIECGALDGETRSNSLFFERERNWNGLLLEPGPVNYRRMVKKHRKAYISPACLGVEPFPSRKYFHRGKNRGRLLDAEDSYGWVSDQFMILDRTGVQCMPLLSFLLALNQTHIDYFSLDVEGVELEVLKSIPFHLLDIDVITVEFAHGRATKEELRDYVTNVLGYKVVWEVSRKDWLANDFVLVKQSKIRENRK